MFKKMKGKIFAGVASIAYLFALSGITPNCWFTAYDPEIPEELLK
jgi:cyclic lactone autoinducer peptide